MLWIKVIRLKQVNSAFSDSCTPTFVALIFFSFLFFSFSFFLFFFTNVHLVNSKEQMHSSLQQSLCQWDDINDGLLHRQLV